MGIESFFRWLADTQGINVSVVYDAYDRAHFLYGLWTTAWLSIVAGALSIVIGLIGTALLTAPVRPLRWASRAYVEAFRNTPPLVQLLFFYFAVGGLLPTVRDSYGASVPLVSNAGWAVVSFSLFAGAFNVEIFRSGLEAVPRATEEAAEALGYTRLQALRHVALPLALRVCLPALGNNLVNLVKTTSLAYAIAVPELLYASSEIWGESMNVRETMNAMLLAYILLIALLVWALHRFERALRIPGWSP
ncbi:MAG TPA: amino acid ABC transporter permease [Acidisphaera sp.]|nr:amino acid ABC transporter permease [Acidisphaera sp.]